jgi:hypothetical protein
MSLRENIQNGAVVSTKLTDYAQPEELELSKPRGWS